MTKLQRFSGEKIIKVLRRAEFEIIRQHGSHAVLRQGDGRTTVVTHPQRRRYQAWFVTKDFAGH